MRLRVLAVHHFSSATVKLRLHRPPIDLEAGQCFNIGVPGTGINREYSIYSGAQDPFLEFLIRVVENGSVSPRLMDIRVGDDLEVHGPYGKFTLTHADAEIDKFIFIATGTGIAPFHSFVRTFSNLKYLLVHGVRSKQDLYDRNIYPSETYIPCVSGPMEMTKYPRVTDYLRANSFNEECKVFLCGNRRMIFEALDLLQEKGVSLGKIYTEVFF